MSRLIDAIAQFIKYLFGEPLTKEQQYALVYEVWRKRFWWRFPPSEGWAIGYTCDRIPQEAHEHLRRFGRIVPPTRNEIISDWNDYGAGKDVKLRYCPADTNIHHSLPKAA